VRHRQTKESATDRLRLNHRVTPRLHQVDSKFPVTRASSSGRRNTIQCIVADGLSVDTITMFHSYDHFPARMSFFKITESFGHLA
jgi:hypothetical protein